MTRRQFLVLLAQGAAFPFVLAATGCTRVQSPRSDAPHLHKVNIDVSDPTKEVIRGHLEQAFADQRPLPSDCLVQIYTFANTLERIYSGAPIRSTDDFYRKVSSEVLKRTASNQETVTRTELVLTEAARASTGRSMVGITICSDGGMEDLSSAVRNEIAAGVLSLSENPAIQQVIITGVLPKHQLMWARWLEPLGGRAAVRGASDAAGNPRYWEVEK